MTDFHSELCSYHAVSPDPLIPGCRNTGQEEDGIWFNEPEPLLGVCTFLGRTSIVEATALLFGLTPEAVTKALTKKPRRKEPDTE
jgi:hypothetical protein